MSVLPFDPPSDSYLSVVSALTNKLVDQQRTLKALDAYYEGRQPLAYIAPEVQAQVGDRLPPVVVNWPRVIVDSVQRRSSVEGFRVGAGGQADAELWQIWQANDLDEWAALGQVASLIHGRSALLVWSEDGRPRITVESAHQVAFVYRPGSETIRAGFKTWDEGDTRHGVLYLADQIRRYEAPINAVDGAALSTVDAPWRLVEVIPNPLGAVPLVPLVNRPLLWNRDGESELSDVVPLADAVNKLATDLMVVSENFAGPRRWATGLEIPNAAAHRERLQAEVRAHWEQSVDRKKMLLGGPGAQFGQFPEAQLSNFVEAIGMFTGQIAAISGLPPHYLGINTENPASADAIRSAEATLVERAREKHRFWGNSYEQAMRLAVAVRDGIRVADLPPELSMMETAWRDPQTPTVAQSADAAVKLHAEGIIDDVQAQENVGLSAAQIAAIKARREAAAATAATADVQARLNLADQLVADKGMTYNAALAAVGLLAAAAANATPAPPA